MHVLSCSTIAQFTQLYHILFKSEEFAALTIWNLTKLTRYSVMEYYAIYHIYKGMMEAYVIYVAV